MTHRIEISRRATALRRAIAAALVVAGCNGCTPYQQLLLNLVPDGTIPMLLSHFERVSDVNRRRISEFEQKRDWAGLAKFAEENIALDKSNSNWWLIAGYAYSQDGQRQRATECYSEVVRLDPQDMLGWNLLVQSHQLGGQPERAVQVANRALDVSRDSPETWFLLGESYSDLNRLEPAAKAYLQAVQLEQRYSRAWLGLGKVYKRLGRTADYDRVAQTLGRLDPALAEQLRRF